ncbi:solute:Na+ symporter, SSS family [Arboricoccus pini]|uniref:Solute:Na+ symporter, SSS family n=1 Tax=Arboricoccus pini TaxID=1963835 RepID=A0A212S1Z3_9PROT|nr:sodium:solute symporter [Arboricoccus pini]SNB79099.1 solute:Na+ symporter, SSS family [Arboricoccus pini]
MNAALPIIGAAALGALILGLRARRGTEMTLEQWSVGGRSFGAVLVFVLMAGEIYTTFTFLGASGYAYGKGAPAYYIFCYATLSFVISYWLLPPIWRHAKRVRLHSQPELFDALYQSRSLGLLVACVGLVALIPYLVLQFKGLGIIVEAASYGIINPTLAVWLGATLLTAYVVVSGVHGSVWTAIVKDTLILLVIAFMGFYLPYHYYGGVGAMFAAIEQARPGFLAFPATGQSFFWFSSTTLLTALGFYMWPHSFAAIFTAADTRTFRRNAIVMPLYALIMLFAILVGLAAILQVPGLNGGEIDLALLRLSLATFDPWFVGVIGAAGVLTALVPGSMILISAATAFASSIYRTFDRGADAKRVSLVAKSAVPVVALIGVYFTLQGGDTIVALLLMGYSFVTQLFPSLVAGLSGRRPLTALGAGAGILAGVGAVAWTVLTHQTFATLFPGLPQWAKDLNIGIVALGLNFVVAIVVTLLQRLAGNYRRVVAG